MTDNRDDGMTDVHKAIMELRNRGREHVQTALNCQTARYLATLSVAGSALSVIRATEEQKVIDEAGGEKALGSNAAARERALLIALAGNDAIERATAAVRDARAAMETAKVSAEAHFLLARLEKATISALGSIPWAAGG